MFCPLLPPEVLKNGTHPLPLNLTFQILLTRFCMTFCHTGFRWAWGIPYGVNRLIARYCIYLKKYWSWNSAMHHFGNLETCTTTYQLGGHRILVIFFRWAWDVSYGVN